MTSRTVGESKIICPFLVPASRAQQQNYQLRTRWHGSQHTPSPWWNLNEKVHLQYEGWKNIVDHTGMACPRHKDFFALWEAFPYSVLERVCFHGAFPWIQQCFIDLAVVMLTHIVCARTAWCAHPLTIMTRPGYRSLQVFFKLDPHVFVRLDMFYFCLPEITEELS
jgi:hypothetical protein